MGLMRSLDQTKKAVKSARAARRKRWICFFIILIIVIIAVVIGVYYGLVSFWLFSSAPYLSCPSPVYRKYTLLARHLERRRLTRPSPSSHSSSLSIEEKLIKPHCILPPFLPLLRPFHYPIQTFTQCRKHATTTTTTPHDSDSLKWTTSTRFKSTTLLISLSRLTLVFCPLPQLYPLSLADFSSLSPSHKISATYRLFILVVFPHSPR